MSIPKFVLEEIEAIPYITLIQAPGIPASEVKALKKLYQEAILDPDYTVVINYEARVDIVETPKGSKLFVQAPAIPTSEVDRLTKKVRKAVKAAKPKDRLVVVNYEVRIDSIPA